MGAGSGGWMSEAIRMAVGEILTAIGAVLGVVVWLVRLEGRVNGHDDRHEDHDKRHDEIRSDVSYIRERIDRALSRSDR